MRKTLMCAALLAAGLATSVAQNVYSLNVVGYVNVPVAGSGAGQFTMIANPLNTTNNTIAALLPNVPNFTQLYKFDGTSFDISQMFFGAWDKPNTTLNPGEGAIIQSSSPFTNTFVGEVMQGNLTNNYPAGFSIRASMVPQAGTLTELGLTTLQNFDQVYQFNTETQEYGIKQLFFGTWQPSEPTLKVGESMWLQTAASGQWVRSFTVN